MIKITPTTVSGLTHADYTVLLPADLDIHKARGQKIANTLSGVPVVTLWSKSRVGSTQSLTVTISATQYLVLKKIVYHQTIFEWLTISNDETFVCGIDLTNSKKVVRNGSNEWREVNVSFVIVEEK